MVRAPFRTHLNWYQKERLPVYRGFIRYYVSVKRSLRVTEMPPCTKLRCKGYSFTTRILQVTRALHILWMKLCVSVSDSSTIQTGEMKLIKPETLSQTTTWQFLGTHSTTSLRWLLVRNIVRVAENHYTKIVHHLYLFNNVPCPGKHLPESVQDTFHEADKGYFWDLQYFIWGIHSSSKPLRVVHIERLNFVPCERLWN